MKSVRWRSLIRLKHAWRRSGTEKLQRELATSLPAFRDWVHDNHKAIRSTSSPEQAEYMSRVSELHAAVCRIADLPWLEGVFSPLVTDGRMAYYYGRVDRGGKCWFVKVAPPQHSRYRVYSALVDGNLPTVGHRFECLAPEYTAWLDSVAAIYVFPYWPVLPEKIPGRHSSPLVAKGLAEFNLSVDESACSNEVGLRRLSLNLRPLRKKDFTRVGLTHGHGVDEYILRHREIRDVWFKRRGVLEELPKGLMHGDFSLTNFCGLDGRLFLMDLDDACIGPLGGDLAWMLFYAERIVDPNQRKRRIHKVMRRYSEACRKLGKPLDEGQALCAAQAVYYKNWLFPGRGTRSNIKNLRWRQEEALRFLQELN